MLHIVIYFVFLLGGAAALSTFVDGGFLQGVAAGALWGFMFPTFWKHFIDFKSPS